MDGQIYVDTEGAINFCRVVEHLPECSYVFFGVCLVLVLVGFFGILVALHRRARVACGLDSVSDGPQAPEPDSLMASFLDIQVSDLINRPVQ